jgi:hypothetical protein
VNLSNSNSSLFISHSKSHFLASFIFIIELARNPPDGVSVGLGDDENIFCWELMIIGPPDTLYEGGFFAAKLVFPSDFPNQPPVMTFKTPLWHPNGNQTRSIFLFLFLLLAPSLICFIDTNVMWINKAHPTR